MCGKSRRTGGKNEARHRCFAKKRHSGLHICSVNGCAFVWRNNAKGWFSRKTF